MLGESERLLYRLGYLVQVAGEEQHKSQLQLQRRLDSRWGAVRVERHQGPTNNDDRLLVTAEVAERASEPGGDACGVGDPASRLVGGGGGLESTECPLIRAGEKGHLAGLFGQIRALEVGRAELRGCHVGGFGGPGGADRLGPLGGFDIGLLGLCRSSSASGSSPAAL